MIVRIKGRQKKAVRALKLKVGLMNDAFPPTLDGTSTATLNYANMIQGKLGEVMVITPRVPGVQDVGYPYEIYRYKSFPLSKKDEYRFGWPFQHEFRHYVRSKKLDILHFHCPLASAHFAKLIVQEQKIPIVATYHTKYDFDVRKRVPTKPLQEFFLRFIINHVNIADEVWVVSEGAGENLRSLGYAGDYTVMPNGVDFPRGKVDTSAITAQYHLADDVPVLLFVGRMMWYKNLRLLLDALRLYRESGHPFRMFMIGKGTDMRAAEKYAAKIGLANEVTFTGKMSDRNLLRSFYSRANAFLFPSTFDTNGLVVREAAACDCPSLLIKGSCAAEGIEEGVTGFLSRETAEDYAKSLDNMLNNPDKLRMVGQNASREIYLSWEDAVRMAYSRYENLCRGWNYPAGYHDKNWGKEQEGAQQQ